MAAVSSFALILLAGQKRTPRRGEQQGWNDNRGTDVVLDRAERRSYREYRPYDTERQADWTAEKFTDEKYVPLGWPGPLRFLDHC